MRPRLASWPLWWLSAQSTGRCGSSRPGRRGAGTCRRGTARPRVPLRHRVALWPLPRLLIFFLNSRQKPRSRGAFFLLNDQRQRLTSNDDASNGGASDGGDASPNVCDASGGASPSAGDAGPNAFDPSRDDGRGPSALLPA